MRRNQFKLLVDVLLLVAAFLTFASGVFLFFDFHVGEGAFRTSALGLTRLTWLNFHRLPALMVVAGIGLHVALNWGGFVTRLRRGFSRGHKSRAITELVMYATCGTVAMTGIAVWLFISGSAPIEGPFWLGQPHHIRHQLVDVHNIAGLVALGLTTHHVGHRWRAMVRGLRSWAHQSSGRGADRMASRPETSPGVS
jgi:hypothetical protein